MGSNKRDKIKLKKDQFKTDFFIKSNFTLLKGKKDIGVAEVKHYENDKVSELSFIYIDEKYRNAGLSNRLMKAIVTDIDKKGYVGKLDLVNRKSQVPKLEHLYEDYGFQKCGSEECYSEGKNDPFCTVPYLREGLKYDKSSAEFKKEKKKWCGNTRKKNR